MANAMKKSSNTVVVIDNPAKIGTKSMKSIKLGSERRFRVMDRKTINNAAKQISRKKEPA